MRSKWSGSQSLSRAGPCPHFPPPYPSLAALVSGVALFKVTVISWVGPQLGKASGSFHLSGYSGFGDGRMSYGGVAMGGISGHWEARALLVGGEAAALGLWRGPPSGVTGYTAGPSGGTGARNSHRYVHSRLTAIALLWAGWLHEPINPLLVHLGCSWVSLPHRLRAWPHVLSFCLRGGCRRGLGFGPVRAGGSRTEPFNYNRALGPQAPLWEERSSS